MALDAAAPTGALLSMADLERMNLAYPEVAQYGYDLQSLERRGKRVAGELLDLFPFAKRTLEVGCWDAMTSAALCRSGRDCEAIDFNDAGFDSRAKDAGVAFAKMDATKLDYPDDTFDLAFSVNTFEHLPDPRAAFSEMLRVVKPGGIVFQRFGPLFMSPLGLHAYRSIRIPYCQFLFTEEDLQAFALTTEAGRIEFETLNRFRPEQYRSVFMDTRADILRYIENRNYQHETLVRKHVGLFKQVSSSVEDFVIDSIEGIFRKKPLGALTRLNEKCLPGRKAERP